MRRAWCALYFGLALINFSGAHAVENYVLPLRITSPDGRNAISISVEGREGDTQVTYTVERDRKRIVAPSRLGPALIEGGDLSRNVRLGPASQRDVEQRDRLWWGKTAELASHGRAGEIEFISPTNIRWVVELRAYDDGVAFRYRLPEQDKLDNVELSEEVTEFRLENDATALYSGYDKYTSSHEAAFERKAIAEIPADKLLEMPLLVTWPGGQAAALAEARLRHFAGMYLQRSENDPSKLRARLSPLPSRANVCVAGKTPVESPWRVVLLGDHAGKLLESNLLLALNDPPPAGDYAWATPGKTTWHWWNGEFEELYKNPGSGEEFEKHKTYIDFCAKHNVLYHSITGDGRPWYSQKDPDYLPRPDSDVLTPRPDLRLPEIVAYAKQRGVRIRVWAPWHLLKDKYEEFFARLEELGVAGLMIDFLDRDDQEMIELSERMLESAARHHVHIQYHGSPKFSGEQRTFPNLLNREGVMNLEYLKWTDTVTPQHNVNVAYTRALAGPVDYHLGGFRSVSRAEFKPRNVLPTVMGTRCHHLALYVVYENPMPMVADVPSAYENQPGLDFVGEVPTTWDETRFVAGEPGEFIVMARRRGDVWYVGGITNWSMRSTAVPLSFLGKGEFAAKVWADGSMNESRPTDVSIEERTVEAASSLTAELAPGGGLVAIIRPK